MNPVVLDLKNQVRTLASMISKSSRRAVHQAGAGTLISRLGLMFWLTRKSLFHKAARTVREAGVGRQAERDAPVPL